MRRRFLQAGRMGVLSASLAGVVGGGALGLAAYALTHTGSAPGVTAAAATDAPPPSALSVQKVRTVGLGDLGLTSAGSWFRRVCIDDRSAIACIGTQGGAAVPTAALAQRVDAVIAAHAPVVVVQGGTYDLLQGRSVSSAVGGLASIVDRLVAAHVRPVVATVPPSKAAPAAVLQLNDAIRAMTRAKRVPLLDLYSSVGLADGRWKPGTSADGVQPDDAGEAALAKDATELLQAYADLGGLAVPTSG